MPVLRFENVKPPQEVSHTKAENPLTCQIPASCPITCSFTPEYSRLGVRELRPLARAAGIPSPHRLKKADLISLLEAV